MRLLVFAEDFYPTTSGGAHSQWGFCRYAAQRGHKITVITPKVKGAPRREIVDDVEIIRPFRAKPDSVPAYSGFAKVTRTLFSVLLFGYVFSTQRSRGYDGIYCEAHTMHWVAKVLSKYTDIPLVSFVGYTPTQKGEFRFTPAFIRERINFRYFLGDAVFCRVPEVRDTIAKYGNNRVEIIHGVLDQVVIQDSVSDACVSSLRDELGLSEAQCMIVFVGRLSPLKRPTKAIEIVSRLPEDTHLVIIGDGPERSDAEKFAQDLSIWERVHFVGTIPHADAIQLIFAADALLLTSRSEAYPTVVFEALAASTPVFATPVGILPEIDHSDLHLRGMGSLAQSIEEATVSERKRIDEKTLNRFSLKEFTSTIIESFNCLINE